MGYLDKVAVIQEDYRGLLRSSTADKAGGATLEEETLHNAAIDYAEDAIVNLATAIHFVHEPPGEEPQNKELILRDAVSILDHIDTLGMEIRFKS